MSIIRVSKRERFVVIDKTGLEDARLSFRTTGILAYLLSKPDDWSINYRDLVTRKSDGKTAVLRSLRELESAGYLRRERKHVGGRYHWEQVLYEAPRNAQKSGALSGNKNNALKSGAITEEGLNERSNAPETARGFEMCEVCECAVPLRDWEEHQKQHGVGVSA